MKEKCMFCNPDKGNILKSGKFVKILVPNRLHIKPEDGGHLVVVPNRHIRSRLELTKEEAMEMWEYSLLGSQLLKNILGTEWFNFQENGNWTVDNLEKSHLHLHIYGRSYLSKVQPFGESLRMPLRKELKSWDFGKYSPELLKELHELSQKL